MDTGKIEKFLIENICEFSNLVNSKELEESIKWYNIGRIAAYREMLAYINGEKEVIKNDK